MLTEKQWMILMVLREGGLSRQQMANRFGNRELTRLDKSLAVLQRDGLVIFRGDWFEITGVGRAHLSELVKPRNRVQAEVRLEAWIKVIISG